MPAGVQSTAPRQLPRRFRVTFAGAMVGLAACGSSSTQTTSTAAAPGASFSTAAIAGLGTVLVDGRGRTVYVLTVDGTTNVACDDASGCTKVWPDLPLPAGTSAAAPGSGVQASLLGTTKVAAETYPTYHGWLMYEFTGDTDKAQAHGQGLQSFGGTWYALSPAGTPITAALAAATTTGGRGAY